MYGVYLIAVLVLIGGMIAYVGDHIGRSLGRRRLSLFGLRPKHTSVIITVLTGICIVAASIATMALLSHDVRSALFHMREIQAAYAESRRQYAESQKQLALLQAQVAQSEEYLAGLIASRDAAAEENRHLQWQNIDLQERLLAAKEELDGWKRQVVDLQQLGNALQGHVRQLEGTKQELENRVARLTDELRSLENQMRQGQFIYLSGEIVHDAVFTGGRPEAEIEEDLLAFLEEADALALARGAHIQGKRRAIEIAHEDYFFQTVDVLAQTDTSWVVRAVALQNTVQGEPLLIYFHLFPDVAPIYERGETIVSEILDPTAQDLEGRLLDLLERAKDDALRRGMITGDDGTVGEIPSDAFIEALVRLRRAEKPVLVKAVADQDTWITEGPLRVRLVFGEDPA